MGVVLSWCHHSYWNELTLQPGPLCRTGVPGATDTEGDHIKKRTTQVIHFSHYLFHYCVS